MYRLWFILFFIILNQSFSFLFKKFISTMYIYLIKGTHFSAWYYITFSKITTCIGFLKIHQFNYRYTILSYWLQWYIWEIHCACKLVPKTAKSNFQKNNPHSKGEVTLFVFKFFYNAVSSLCHLTSWIQVTIKEN